MAKDPNFLRSILGGGKDFQPVDPLGQEGVAHPVDTFNEPNPFPTDDAFRNPVGRGMGAIIGAQMNPFGEDGPGSVAAPGEGMPGPSNDPALGAAGARSMPPPSPAEGAAAARGLQGFDPSPVARTPEQAAAGPYIPEQMDEYLNRVTDDDALSGVMGGPQVGEGLSHEGARNIMSAIATAPGLVASVPAALAATGVRGSAQGVSPLMAWLRTMLGRGNARAPIPGQQALQRPIGSGRPINTPSSIPAGAPKGTQGELFPASAFGGP